MAAVTYTKADWVAQADIQRLANGKFQGVVLIARGGAREEEQATRAVNTTSDTPEEALEEAKALAHRLLGDIGP